MLLNTNSDQAGSVIVSHVTSLPATWICLLSLLAIHLATNHRAVRAVQMTSLNRQRANIVFSAISETDLLEQDPDTEMVTDVKFLRPDEAARDEKVFERDGVLRWFSFLSSSSSSSPSSNEKLGWCRIGSSMQELIIPSSSSSSFMLTTSLWKLFHIFSSEQYILVPHRPNHHHHLQKETTITILLKQNCTPTQQLKAWAHALLVARLAAAASSKPVPSKKSINIHDDGDDDEIMAILSDSLDDFSARFDNFYVEELKLAGWDLDTAALETRPGRRINIADS
jgi:hypothetical protein